MDNFLCNLVNMSHHAANVKDISTGKYILINYAALQALEVESVYSFIGKTTSDIYAEGGIYKKDLGASITSWRHGEEEKIKAFELQAQCTQRPVSFKRVYFTVNGLIRFENCTKLAISNSENKKTIMMLTCAQDLTLQLGLFHLFQLYQGYYSKQRAIQQILKHLELETYFNLSDLPTCKEMQVLFVMREDHRFKRIAKRLDCSVETVNNHICHLRNKLVSISLEDFLAQLRAIPVDERNRPHTHACIL